MWRSENVSSGAKREDAGFKLASPRACKKRARWLAKRLTPGAKRSIISDKRVTDTVEDAGRD